MSTRRKNESDLSRKDANSAASGRRRGMTIDVSGKAPGVSRSELRAWARAALRHLQLTQAELSLALVADATIHALNRRYRGKDKPTDVLAFPLADEVQPSLLGDVVISVETASRQARRRGHPLREELQVLLVHGILHLAGYDHEVSRSEAVRMRRKERGIIRALNDVEHKT
jgi:probable rRNA maturation factor